MILALDPGVRTGFASEDGYSGVYDCTPYRADLGSAAALFADWLEAILPGVTLLAIERPFFHRHAPDASLTEWLIAHAHSVAWQKAIPRTEVAASSVRSWLLGKGLGRRITVAGTKESVGEFDERVRFAVASRGIAVENEHAADAAALMLYVREARRPVAA